MDRILSDKDKIATTTDSADGGEFCLFCDDDYRPDAPRASWKQKNTRTITVDNDRYNEALRYGFRILPLTRNYPAFCAALTDFMGRDIIPCCDFIYSEITRSVPKKFSRKLIDPGYKGECTEELIAGEMKVIDDLQKEDRSWLPEGNTDELQFVDTTFRNISAFKDLISFIAIHPFLSPYNALLVYMQKSDATLVFDAGTWARNYERRPKSDAQKLITLNGDSVRLMYDFSDTEMILQQVNSLFDFEYELKERWKELNDREQRFNVDAEMRNLQANMPTYGVFLDWSLKADDAFVGYTDSYKDKELIINTSEGIFKYHSYFRISVNNRYPEEEAFYFICGELAGLFLRDDIYGLRGVEERTMTVKEYEFERETVKCIVFNRLGLYYPADDVLERFCREGRIPVYSIERILRAADELEKMLKGVVMPKDSMLYKVDCGFKETAENGKK